MQGWPAHGARARMPRLVTGAALLAVLLLTWSAQEAGAQAQSPMPRYRLQEDRSAGVRAGTWHVVKDGKRVEFLDSRDVFSRHAETPKPVLFLDLFADPQGRVQQVRVLPASETRKQLYVNFLKKRYGYQISAVNQAYGIEASAFTELE